MKRIFVAIPISLETQNLAIEIKKKYSSLKVRWLSGKNLHITLIPPWYENDIELIKNKLRKISGKISLFKAVFTKITFGPNSYRPRLIWAEGKTPSEIPSLKKNLEIIPSKKTEIRPFILHLTLARFRSEDFRYFPIKKMEEKISWEENINSIILMESHLSPSGADYEILEEFKFGRF